MRQLLIVFAASALAACAAFPEFTLAEPEEEASAPASVAPPPQQPAPPPPYAPPPDQQLLELERQLSAAAQESGLGAALAAALDREAGVVIRPGAMLSAGEVEAGLTAPRGAGPLYWQPDRVHVSRSGDMGVTSGRYVQVVTGAEAVQGRYVTVWRREGRNGDWKILTETRIPDPPRRR